MTQGDKVPTPCMADMGPADVRRRCPLDDAGVSLCFSCLGTTGLGHLAICKVPPSLVRGCARRLVAAAVFAKGIERAAVLQLVLQLVLPLSDAERLWPPAQAAAAQSAFEGSVEELLAAAGSGATAGEPVSPAWRGRPAGWWEPSDG